MEETHRGFYSIQEYRIDDKIPSLLISKKTKGESAIIYVHAAFLWKEYDLPLILRFVDRGLTVLSIDAFRHGKRRTFVPKEYRQLFNDASRDFPKTMLSIFIETAKNIPTIVDYLEQSGNFSSVGVVGYSMGGFVALLAPILERRLKAAVGFGAGGDWQFLFEQSSFPRLMGFSWNPNKDIDEDTKLILSEWDPLNRAEELAPCAILLLNGTNDKVVPLICAERLYQALEPHYKRFSHRLRLNKYPCGHEITPAMADEATSWLCKNLHDD